MNVIIVNQQENIISSINIEIIKKMKGIFTADDIIGTFNNFFFSHMIIDVTALENCDDAVTYQKLSIGLPIDKIILLEVKMAEEKKNLQIIFLFLKKMIYQLKMDVVKLLLHLLFDLDHIILLIPPTSSMAGNYFLSKLISMGYYNFTTNVDGIIYLMNTPNTYKDVAHIHQIEQPQAQINTDSGIVMSNIRTLGIKNVTDNAGASSLIYMMKRELEEKYNLSVLALEVDKRDFAFFREKNMLSTDRSSIATELLKAKNYNYILVDLNDYDENVCDETLYLIEPSVIKLNKLMLRDRNIFSKLKDKKVIINRSVLNEADVNEFSKEAGINIFSTLPAINDRELSEDISQLLLKLGMIKNV